MILGMRYRQFIATNVIGLVVTGLFSQAVRGQVAHPLHAQIETGGITSSCGETPFWLRVNQFGIIPQAAPLAMVRVRVSRTDNAVDTATHQTNRFGWGFALNPVLNLGSRNQLLLPEVYVTVRSNTFEMWAGRRRELIGLGDSLLSSGFVIGSGNALPIPKIQLATRGYVPLKFLKRFVAINAGYAHGWFTNAYIQGSYLHQKYLYWRFGKPKSFLKVHLGLNHQVQWGGQADYLLTSPYALNGRLPASFSYYGNIIMATRPNDIENDDYNSFDGAYRIGNHVGGHDLGIQLTTTRETILLYFQHPFEDVSGLLWQNLPDGLIGFSWRRLVIDRLAAGQLDHFVLEYLTTLDQSGSTFWVPNSAYQGADNYFNHAQYREGWSYHGRAIGTPFIAPQTELRSAINRSVFFADNRVEVYYAGAEGRLINKLRWTIKLAYSWHYGTYAEQFDRALTQYSFLLSTRTGLGKLSKTWLQTAIALDCGEVYPSTLGASLSLSHTIFGKTRSSTN
ncbi:capsule assembly Wzi family protein [Fibrella forsythiae]|uniref:Capsule assembly Wzi family protein n=1 Tax=Fibrella forsythiae TaxID=2817061 RepID=A0ABS3JRJ9_9BACT|nr:capsule assembly Wzi family protein [Fibrella forsythiae]MBO0952639.1 hypothetical protein [Fibrella forsythiae]